MNLKILGIGNPLFDRTTHVKSLQDKFEKGTNTIEWNKFVVDASWKKAHGTANDYQWTLGGSSTNVIRALSHLGHSCSLLGKVGRDRKQEIEDLLKRIGVTSLLLEGKKEAGFVNCFITPDSERTMHVFLGASEEFSKEDILPRHFNDASHVHLIGYLSYNNGVIEESLRLAKEKGATVSLDLSSVEVVNTFKDKLKACANKVDILFGNFQEMQAFTGCQEISGMINKLPAKQMVVITNGSQPCWVKLPNKQGALKYDALKIRNVVNTTGAGDFFIAGFLSGFVGKKDISTCVKIAHLVASFVIQHDGTDLPEDQWIVLKKRVSELALSNLSKKGC